MTGKLPCFGYELKESSGRVYRDGANEGGLRSYLSWVVIGTAIGCLAGLAITLYLLGLNSIYGSEKSFPLLAVLCKIPFPVFGLLFGASVGFVCNFYRRKEKGKLIKFFFVSWVICFLVLAAVPQVVFFFSWIPAVIFTAIYGIYKRLKRNRQQSL